MKSSQTENTETDTSDEETVGTGGDERLSKLAAIADSTEQVREEEFANVNDDGTTEPFQATAKKPDEEEEEVPASTEETPAEVAAPDTQAPKTFKIKVNGKELELTEAQLIERAQKIEAADEYLRQAAEAKRKAVEPEVPAGPTPEELQRQRDDEDRALVRAIQVGTEEEAAAALRKIREQASARPSLSRDDVSRTIDERLAFNTAIEKFSSEFSDIWGDPTLKKLALERDGELIESGDRRPYYERYSEIGTELRSWVSKVAPKAEPKTIEEKEARKAAAPKIPTSASAKAKAKVQNDEPEETTQDIIANMAKVRGGPQWMRG